MKWSKKFGIAQNIEKYLYINIDIYKYIFIEIE